MPTTTERGYGYHHQKLRRAWARRVRRGEVTCARCGWLIEPGDEWHLGHDDHDRRYYNGPEHADCNLRAAGIKAGAIRRGDRTDPPITSRPW